MNCVTRFVQCAEERPDQMALWTEVTGPVSYRDLFEATCRAQSLFRSRGAGPGNPVIIAALPGVGLFASILALLGLGAPILLIEPWLSIERINHIVDMMKPKVFFSGLIGKLWGLRIPSIRRIPYWDTERSIRKSSLSGFHIENLEPYAPGVVAFSSGTSGAPKGAIRTQRYLWDIHEILVKNDPESHLDGPDLSVFANVALFQLGTGRGAILVPNSWNPSTLRKIDALAEHLQAQSLSCGPGFLKRLISIGGFANLRSLHLGGALTDTWILEEAFRFWPKARFTHVYGGSEAEPVSLADAREAVRLSQNRGYFQTLWVGKPISEIRAHLGGEALGEKADESIWVAGPNVCPEYIGDISQNKGVKIRDSQSTLWHRMGDRIRSDSQGWWFSGRAFQPLRDFELEQRIYSRIQSSACFLERSPKGEAYLFGNAAYLCKSRLKAEFPEIREVHPAKIVRDRRHRARIDRQAILKNGAPWLKTSG